MIQQARWYKGFYRETLVFFPRLFNYSWYSVLVLSYSFIIPFLAFVTVFTALLKLEDLIFFMIYIFAATLLMSLRGVFRSCRLRFFHAMTHPFFFFLFLLPLKFMGLINCFCSDFKKKKDQSKVLIPVYLWIILGTAALITVGFILNIVIQGENLNKWMSSTIFAIGIFELLLIVHWIIWGLGYFVPKNADKLAQMYHSKRVAAQSAVNLVTKDQKAFNTETGSSNP